MKRTLFFALFATIIFFACSPATSEYVIRTATAQKQATLPSPSNTPISTTDMPELTTPTMPIATATATSTATITPTLITTGRLAFKSYRDGHDAIYLINADGSGLTKSTDDMAAILSFGWSPDGTRIVFSACLDGDVECTGNFEIFVINVDGSQLTNLTNNPAEDMNPAWSPDNRQIVFNSNRSGNHEIYVMNADGSGTKQLTNNPTDDTDPQWSPDGARIAFVSTHGFCEIWVMDSDGSKMTRVTEGVTPIWSPDSTQMAFHDAIDKHLEIFSIKPDGTGLVNLSNSSADEFGFSWSPDGKRIAFVSNRDYNAEIYMVYIDYAKGTEPVNLTNDPANDQDPIWSPDGTRIAFLSDESLYIMNADGSHKTRLATKVVGSVAWQP